MIIKSSTIQFKINLEGKKNTFHVITLTQKESKAKLKSYWRPKISKRVKKNKSHGSARITDISLTKIVSAIELTIYDLMLARKEAHGSREL